MPMSNSNYVAPTWVDGGPPALDAAELQAMCDAIVQNQGDAAALQAAVQTLTSTVSGKAQITTGSYVGTGTDVVTLNGISDCKIMFIMCVDVGNGSGRIGIFPCLVKDIQVPSGAMFIGGALSQSIDYYYGATIRNTENSITIYDPQKNHNFLGKSYYYISLL